MSHVGHMPRKSMRHVAYINESRHTYQRVTSHISLGVMRVRVMRVRVMRVRVADAGAAAFFCIQDSFVYRALLYTGLFCGKASSCGSGGAAALFADIYRAVLYVYRALLYIGLFCGNASSCGSGGAAAFNTAPPLGGLFFICRALLHVYTGSFVYV